MKYAIVVTTTDKKEIAAKIANALIRKKLAACVQMWPITSTFSWKGKVMTGKEWIMLIKAKAVDYKKIEKEIKLIHNYELPEIIAVPIANGSKEYLNWIEKTTR